MKSILFLVIGLSSTAVLYGATIVAGCVTDANGKAVAGAKVFAAPEWGDKTYRAETRKSDGCYEMKIAKDGVYGVGVRDARYAADGPVQRFITASGLDLPKIDLSTDVPNAKLLTQRVSDAALSASEGFARVRRGVRGGDVPVITAEVPSGFGSCMLQSSNAHNGPTAMWWCTTGGIRDEKATHAMFESIRGSITTALGSLGQLRYSLMKPAGGFCEACVDWAVWASPINGVVALSQTKVKKRNALVLWTAYNSPMTEEGCASIRKNEEPKVDFAKYDSAVTAMRGEYYRQLNAAIKAALSTIFLPGGIKSSQQSGVIGTSIVSPNACLDHRGPTGRSANSSPTATPSSAAEPGKDIPGPAMLTGPAAPVIPGSAVQRSIAVAVVDDNGHFIPGIPRGNFRILEGGVLRPILEFKEFQQDRAPGDSPGGSRDPASGYRISYQPLNPGEAAVASTITVELIETHTNKPLIIKDNKGKLLRYRTVVTDSPNASLPVVLAGSPATNFSGRWSLVSKTSNTGETWPEVLELEIAGPVVRLGGKVTFYTDGRPMVYPNDSVKMTGYARWSDGVLVIETEQRPNEKGVVTVTARYSLSVDGSMLTVARLYRVTGNLGAVVKAKEKLGSISALYRRE